MGVASSGSISVPKGNIILNINLLTLALFYIIVHKAPEKSRHNQSNPPAAEISLECLSQGSELLAKYEIFLVLLLINLWIKKKEKKFALS